MGKPVVHWEFWSRNTEDPEDRVLGIWQQAPAE